VTHLSNWIVKDANDGLEKAAVDINMSSSISVLPVCKELEAIIKQDNAPR
jgi:hypothetical protein